MIAPTFQMEQKIAHSIAAAGLLGPDLVLSCHLGYLTTTAAPNLFSRDRAFTFF